MKPGFAGSCPAPRRRGVKIIMETPGRLALNMTQPPSGVTVKLSLGRRRSPSALDSAVMVMLGCFEDTLERYVHAYELQAIQIGREQLKWLVDRNADLNAEPSPTPGPKKSVFSSLRRFPSMYLKPLGHLSKRYST